MIFGAVTLAAYGYAIRHAMMLRYAPRAFISLFYEAYTALCHFRTRMHRQAVYDAGSGVCRQRDAPRCCASYMSAAAARDCYAPR